MWLSCLREADFTDDGGGEAGPQVGVLSRYTGSEVQDSSLQPDARWIMVFWVYWVLLVLHDVHHVLSACCVVLRVALTQPGNNTLLNTYTLLNLFCHLKEVTLEQSIKQISVLIFSFCSVQQLTETSRSPAELWQILFPPADVKASTFPYIQRSFIMDSLWKLKQAFFFFSFFLFFWSWVSSGKWIFHLTLHKEGVSFLHSLWCQSTVSHTEWALRWHPSNRQCRPQTPKGLHVCVLFVQRHPAASGISQSPCATL